MRNILLLAAMAIASLTAQAERDTYHIEMMRPIGHSTSQTTNIDARTNYLAQRFGLFRANQMSITAAGDYQMAAEVWGTDDVFTSFTNGTGHWFLADGTPTARAGDSGRRVCVKLSDGELRVAHRANTSNTEYSQVGDEFRFAELFIHEGDTVRYEFHVTLIDDNEEESVSSDLPGDYYHRADQNDEVGVTALMQRNDEKPAAQNWIQVRQGDRITISAMVTDTEAYDSVWIRINDPNGKKMRDYENAPFVLTESATTDMSGQYTMRCQRYRKETAKTSTTSYIFYIDVQDADLDEPLSWDGMIPTFGYDFHDEYGDIPEPQNILGDVASTEYGRMSDGWWTVAWGKNLNPAVGVDPDTNEDVHNAMTNMLAKYNEDFAFIRDEMGWPPDLRAREGYKSTILVYGSGLSTDTADSTETGGWQSATYYQGRSWPCVLASYYPISRFRDDADQLWNDGDYQREAMIHEGIHATFADMDGVKNSAWFHEAGNTWLQSAMAVRRTGDYGTPGYLDGCPFLAPFMPIECYSGWLQDGSFGGPSAEGVNMYDGSQQICTWRTYLGGTQYGNSFPIILSEMCGDESIAWIWRYCSNRVLEGIGDSIGDDMMRKLIVQYRARQAIFDIGGWTTGYRQVTSDYFGQEFGPEWEPYYIDCGKWKATCYQRMRVNDNNGWLAPDEETTPGWSGANIIPIHVNTDSAYARVQFRPEDTEERAILCYKTKAGEAHYSQMTRCGDMVIDLTPTPANGVIFCVVANTDYVYTGDDQRQHHWDYRLRLCEGAKGIADKDKKWFMNEQTITDNNYEDLTRVDDIFADDSNPEETLHNRLQLLTGLVQAGGEICLDVSPDVDPTQVQVRMMGIEGIVADKGHLTPSATYRLPSSLHHGLYVVAFTLDQEQLVYKVIVR